MAVSACLRVRHSSLSVNIITVTEKVTAGGASLHVSPPQYLLLLNGCFPSMVGLDESTVTGFA